MEKYNINCPLEEEIDFEGLAGYICGDLMDDVKLRLFGTKKERGAARQTILKQHIKQPISKRSRKTMCAMNFISY